MTGIVGELKVAAQTLWRKRLFTLAVVATPGTRHRRHHDGLQHRLRGAVQAEPGRLVGVFRFLPDLMGPSVASISDWYAVPYPLYQDWEERATIFESLGGYAPVGMTVTGRGNPERVTGMNATSGVFETLGIAPLLGAAGAARLVESQLFGVSAADPATLAIVTLLVTVATLAESYIPARRATRVAPVEALRCE